MTVNINYRALNDLGLAELEDIKNIEKNKQEIRVNVANPQKNQNLSHLTERLSTHFKSWIKGFPSLITRTGELIRNRNVDAVNLFKRQTWNTFVAKPAEMVVTLISPAIDEVAYKTFCLKIDYDYYLPEKIEKLANELVIDGHILKVKDDIVDGNATDLKALLQVIKTDLKNNPEVKEVRLGDGKESVVITRDIALNLKNLTLNAIIAAHSSNQKAARKLLSETLDRDRDVLGDFIYSENPPFFANRDQFLRVLSLSKDLNIKGLPEKILSQGESFIKEMIAKEVIELAQKMKPHPLPSGTKEFIEEVFNQAFDYVLKITPKSLSEYINKINHSGLTLSKLTFERLAISEDQLELLSKINGLETINMADCEFTGDIQALRERQKVNFEFSDKSFFQP